MKKRKGFMLVVALFLMVVVAVMGMAFLSTRGLRYQEATRSVAHRRALAVAHAGLEDARVKLEKDPGFPPPGGLEQTVFTYQEELTALTNGPRVGLYTVTVDTTWRKEPYGVILLTSRGQVGDRDWPEATAVARAEIDVWPTSRLTGTGTNPNLFKVIRWSEEGNL